MRSHAQTVDTSDASTAPATGDAHERLVRLADTDARVALERARTALGQEGFGVLAEIDFRELLMRRLDKALSPHWTLEVCNPHLAERALALGHAAGLLMPCRVGVWQQGRDAVVALLRPIAMATLTTSQPLRAIAAEAEQHLERALAHLAATASVAPAVETT